jgi:hypothetical protein
MEITKTSRANSRKSLPNQNLALSSEISNEGILFIIGNEIMGNYENRIGFVYVDNPWRGKGKSRASHRSNAGWNPNRSKRRAHPKNVPIRARKSRAGLKCEQAKSNTAIETLETKRFDRGRNADGLQ